MKSFKYHFKRVVGDSTLTFEEMSTLAIHIEALLNSRPLCPLSNDASDLVALTPGHFLVGESLSSVPEPYDENYDLNLKTSRISRWRLLIEM